MAYITLTTSVWGKDGVQLVDLAVPTKYRKLIAVYCAQIGTAPNTQRKAVGRSDRDP